MNNKNSKKGGGKVKSEVLQMETVQKVEKKKKVDKAFHRQNVLLMKN